MTARAWLAGLVVPVLLAALFSPAPFKHALGVIFVLSVIALVKVRD